MRLSEILTIYLAIGAPFGVYSFVQTKKVKNKFAVGLKTLSAMLFFPLLLLPLMRRFVFPANARQNVLFGLDETSAKLDLLQRRLADDFLAHNETDSYPVAKLTKQAVISLFDFREVLERYVGLTMAVRDSAIDSSISESEVAIFQLAGREKEDLQLAGRCLHRKNYLRLQRHQILVQRDFVKIVSALNRQNAISAAIEMANILNDAATAEILQLPVAEQMRRRQKDALANVKSNDSVSQSDVFATEKELWKPATSQPAIKPAFFHLRKNSTATMPTRLRD